MDHNRSNSMDDSVEWARYAGGPTDLKSFNLNK